MVNSKGWEWEKVNQSPWLKPTEDSYYLSNKWLELDFKNILDLGAGLGRHSIFFAKQGFSVSAIDLSDYGMNNLKEWAEKESLNIDIRVGDMNALPYADDSFDCVFAYHVISHTDTLGAKKVISEIERVLRQGGAIYTSMCSKEAWDFAKAGFPKIDENTVINKEDGPEKDVPHFYANRQDILNLFHNFDIEKIRHIDYCYLNGKKQDSKYYYINARKK
ncbi:MULTISPECIES: class I SAM-dependent methyltransferase [unclassified Clostridium]|uniref:class I SAM-dependent methyltransferase n=1 Tax=unclassified Clostridium TaxID=2614128 RepID=UPI000EB8F7A9|nr:MULTISPECIES: class I SAM-dependent methyltransferase [unclassified Clostridium]HCQ89225.1 class I SAM-dependent methyltransferase [Clostridium sp.]